MTNRDRNAIIREHKNATIAKFIFIFLLVGIGVIAFFVVFTFFLDFS